MWINKNLKNIKYEILLNPKIAGNYYKILFYYFLKYYLYFLLVKIDMEVKSIFFSSKI